MPKARRAKHVPKDVEKLHGQLNTLEANGYGPGGASGLAVYFEVRHHRVDQH